jgi:tetratricopeptide (TPR) repeat protein
MDTGKRQHLQDIYSTDRSVTDDYTPQVSAEILEERKREIRRHQFLSFVLGMTVLVLLLALVYVVVREYMDIRSESGAPAPITQQYIPRYSLPAESQWAVDFSSSYGDPTWNGEGERPFNAKWVKKAAFNIILAERAVELGQIEEAATACEDALEIFPELNDVRTMLGRLYYMLERHDDVLVLFDGIADENLDYDILNNLGAACIFTEQYELGEGYLKRSLELQPGYGQAIKNLALLYMEQDRDEESIVYFQKYLLQQPFDTETRYTYALYLTKVGDWELAAEELRILTREVTDVANLYVLLARVETKLGNDKAAIEAFRRAAQLTDPKQALLWMDDEEFERLRADKDFQALIRYYDK